ncbi:MAG: bifunctional serine/threonine-protein kinase/formylglycine-generating enzyme family protein [Candidatus Eiseniibacteriota bacterium]
MLGETVGRFEITDKLGEGGMGVLYRARDPRLGRTVAIKLLRPDAVAESQRTQRLVQEARTLSSLNHPNIVTVYDVGEDDSRGTWIAMECLDGESLRERVARGPLPLAEALRIAVDVARGLAAAHAAGVVHRDLKPANVMITRSGVVKVLDFGLARRPPSVEPGTESTTSTISVPLTTAEHTIVGTPAYMSPEQATGRTVDARSDVFSFGVTLHEMIAGRRPFEGDTGVALLAAILNAAPTPLRRARPEIDPRLEAIVTRCLAKDPAERYASAVALLADLEACATPDRLPAWARRLRSPAGLTLLALLVISLAALGVWTWHRGAQERWARREALPEIQRLIEADDRLGAFRLAEKAQPLLAGDPVFERAWLDITIAPLTLLSEPAGAQVSFKPYSEPDAAWRELGMTPLEGVQLPFALLRFHLAKSGFAPVELAFSPSRLALQAPVRLTPVAAAPADMVRVPGGSFQFRGAPPVVLGDYWLDRHEVTNREFAAFVNAGGYRRRELWKHPFASHGESLSFEEAMSRFRDRTGRPGPSTWELGSFPAEHADHPVSGVSWYEAAAYAEFAGKSLPTVHHWYRAADLSIFSDLLRFSNFGDQGPRPVEAQPSLTAFGNYDMAGNVREWAWNADGDRRYTLGGAWSDPTYLYTGPDALDPMDRGPILGLRCAVYEQPPSDECFGEIQDPVRDFSSLQPVDDRIFEIYRRMFDYDRGELGAQVDSVDDRSPLWRAEKVSFTAAYGDERIPAWLLLPKNAAPPYQTVVYFPPGSARWLLSIDQVGQRDFGFLVRSGRAVLFPAYQQTYHRRKRDAVGPSFLREVVTQRALDVRRGIDYLESRSDIDRTRIAFYGLSMGAEEGTIVGAVEPRLRTLVLVAAGLDESAPEEVHGFNYAPRVRVPVLMINGRYDFASPFETNQQPLFRMLGTPAANKRHVVLDSGHVPPWPDVVRETLDWLDRYLGPVATR